MNIIKLYINKKMSFIYKMFNMKVKKNFLSVTIIIFLILFTLVQMIKPTIFYTHYGALRQFGVGYKQKTVVPVWMFSIILAILTYIGMLYYINL